MDATIPDFPRSVSLTVTHACPLRCEMCVQHSATGTARRRLLPAAPTMKLADWLGVVDQVQEHPSVPILLRGGEPLIFPGLIELVARVRGAGLSLSIDTSGIGLEEHAEALARIGGLHVTVSVDGPPAVHDRIRGVPGTFAALERGVHALRDATRRRGTRVSLSLNCTLMPRNLPTLPELPGVARRLGIGVLTVVPVYWMPAPAGEEHEAILARDLGARALTWRGVPRAVPGVTPEALGEQLRRFRDALGEVELYPFMPLSDAELAQWFRDHATPVGVPCRNAELVLDVQPSGDANFCVDFCDYSIGSVRERGLRELWRGERAMAFRERLRTGSFPACLRCGARYMGEQAARRGDANPS